MLYILGIIIFLGIHLVPAFAGLKARIVSKVGEGPFKGIFSLIATAGLLMIIFGWSAFPNIYFYEPPTFLKSIAVYLMIPAFILLLATYIPSNLRRVIRHPMLSGVKLWTIAHLLANGDLRSMILFVCFLAYSVFAVISANRRGGASESPAVNPMYDGILIAAGIGVWFLVLNYHHYLSGGMPARPFAGF